MNTEWITGEEAAAILGMQRLPVNRLAKDGFVVARKSTTPHRNGSIPWEFDRASVEQRAARMKVNPPTEAECGVDWMPLTEAIAFLGLSRNSVCERIEKGQLQSANFGPPEKHAVFVNRKQVEEHLTDPPHAPRELRPWTPPDITEAKRGWLAGILDGEGCISLIRHVHSRGTQWNIRLTIVNTNPIPIDDATALLGGFKSQRKRDNDLWAPAFVWMASCGQAAAILRYLRDAISIKAEQADLAIQFQDHLDSRAYRIVPPSVIEWRDEQFRKMAELNRRGPTRLQSS